MTLYSIFVKIIKYKWKNYVNYFKVMIRKKLNLNEQKLN